MSEFGKLLERVSERATLRGQEVFDAVYLQPQGTSRAQILLPGCDELQLASAFETFRKGSQVIAAKSPLGGYTLHSSPAAGGGAFRRPIADQLLEEPEPAALIPAWIIYRRGSGGVFAAFHNPEGLFVANVGGGVPVFNLAAKNRNRSAPFAGNATLGDGWIAGWENFEGVAGVDDFQIVHVFDFLNNVNYETTRPGLQQAGPPILQGEFLFWLECTRNDQPPCVSQGAVKLVRAASDLTGITEVATGLLDVPGPGPATPCEWSGLSRPMFSHDRSGLTIGMGINHTGAGAGPQRRVARFQAIDITGSATIVEDLDAQWPFLHPERHPAQSQQLGGLAITIERGVGISADPDFGELVTLDMDDVTNRYVPFGPGGIIGRDVQIPSDNTSVNVLDANETDIQVYNPAGALLRTVPIEDHPTANEPVVHLFAIDPNTLP